MEGTTYDTLPPTCAPSRSPNVNRSTRTGSTGSTPTTTPGALMRWQADGRATPGQLLSSLSPSLLCGLRGAPPPL